MDVALLIFVPYFVSCCYGVPIPAPAGKTVDQLTEKEIAEYRELFNAYDKDGNGVISIDELRDVMKAAGRNPTEEQLQQMMKDIDTDGNGTIDFQEFIAALIQETNKDQKVGQLTEEETAAYREIFKMYDRDGNGVITIDELRDVIRASGQKFTEEQIQQMMKAADTDGSGTIDFQEFLAVMAKQAQAVEEALKESFKAIDKNGDGYITLDELHETLKKIDSSITEEDTKNLISQVDNDSDGRLNFNEFVAMIKESKKH